MGHLRTDNVTPGPELDAIRLVAESLFSAGWTVEMVGSMNTLPSVVALRVLDKNGREVCRGIFQANHLEDVAPFLNRMALAVDTPPGDASP